MTQGQRILCIEDEPAILQMVSECLRMEGYEVRAWPNGETGYEETARALPALVLLDLRMERPDSGMRILQMMRDDPDTREIPVILYSADVVYLQTHAAEIAALGCDALEKPFLIGDLLGRVHRRIGPPLAAAQ